MTDNVEAIKYLGKYFQRTFGDIYMEIYLQFLSILCLLLLQMRILITPLKILSNQIFVDWT